LAYFSLAGVTGVEGIAVAEIDAIGFGQLFSCMRRQGAADANEQAVDPEPDEEALPPASPAPTPLSPLSLSPMSIYSDDEQERRDESFFACLGLVSTPVDDDDAQVLSNASGGAVEDGGVRRRREDRAHPSATEVDSASTARDSEPGSDRATAGDGGSESVHSSPPPYSPTITDDSDGVSFISSSNSSPMLHIGARRRRRAMTWSPSLLHGRRKWLLRSPDPDPPDGASLVQFLLSFKTPGSDDGGDTFD